MLRKFWMAAGGALLMLAHGLLTDDGRMSAYDWSTLAIQTLTAGFVWYQTNGPAGTWEYVAKFAGAAFAAAGALFLPAIADGMITGEEWSKVGIGAVTALLVLGIRNLPRPPEPVPFRADGGTVGA